MKGFEKKNEFLTKLTSFTCGPVIAVLYIKDCEFLVPVVSIAVVRTPQPKATCRGKGLFSLCILKLGRKMVGGAAAEA